ncbi:hypothetical protein HELRODRAFT_81728 [Helobdella robusta]|uniref:Hemerythrin-like domain-containing protein n=1 Tax=Helobdella robusta TaxID=6412 RepID=T1G4I0_HELRO|nr:hypothetical protein HELRODRAFT_174825 [Helobdella robusta]XP_009020514.1 hypothetical protein HELRODRAFT_81728 [Helobdella robusta]XP_009020705.1 hypothetical protein HELRODRAFT_92605 [Helobdella robusta]ESO01199.1 hypothetical protein HELRODRAFT_92605 [Helobdella robusta]ESO01277.1 hypothetical protein HELRODRAFT_174825 [Helobdella robusta]ESO01278.1 hypothetical protein HELRODRAFT_81728 [Helobdella robusta]
MKFLVLLAVCFAATLALDVPEPFVWDDSFLVDYEKLDEQHKGLFKAIFDVCAAPADASAFAHLKDVIEKHFRFEEGMMEAAHYGDLPLHKQIHESFEAALKAGQVPVAAADIKGAKEWLVGHIKTVDFKYKTHL